ncbi:uncharacterized protein LOC144343547 [Saccoglossus kowalevskii]
MIAVEDQILPCHETDYCNGEDYRPCEPYYLRDLMTFKLTAPNQGIIEKLPNETTVLICEAEKKKMETHDLKLWWCDANNRNCFCPNEISPPNQFKPSKEYLKLTYARDNQLYAITNLTVSNLSTEVVHMFVCLVNIGGGPFTDATGNVTIIVREPAMPEIINTSDKTLIAFEGKEARLVCKANGFPTPDLAWKKDDQFLVYNDSEARVYQDDSGWLVIDNVNTRDEGSYQCIATSRIGQNMSNPTKLVVVKQKPSGNKYPWLLPVVIAAAVTAGLMLVLVVICIVRNYRVAKAKKKAANAIDVKSPIRVDGNFVVNTGDNARINIHSVTMGSGEDISQQLAPYQQQAQEAKALMNNGQANGHVTSSTYFCDVFLAHHSVDEHLAQEMKEKLLKRKKRQRIVLQADIQNAKNFNDIYLNIAKQASKIVALISSPFLKSKKCGKLLQKALDLLSEDGDSIHENRYIAVYFVPMNKVPDDLQSVVSLDFNVESDSVYFWQKFPKTILPAGEVFL